MAHTMNVAHVTRVGIDIAKSVFQIHGVDRTGKTIVTMKVSRSKLLSITAQFPPSLIGMEACSGAHFWAKEFEKQGHTVRLIAGQKVKPFVTSGNKDDKVDAAAICEAVGKPGMLFVPCKADHQLEIQALHCHRVQLTKLSTALSNQLRGLLLERGILIPKGINHISKRIPHIIEDAENNLSMVMRNLLQTIYEQFKDTGKRLVEISLKIETICKTNPTCQKITKILGIGPITATALYAAIGNGRQFKKGREAAAWIGMIPRHRGSGGKTRNGKLSRRGNRYIKTLLIQGARSAILAAKRRTDRRSNYINAMVKRKGENITAVACAHRNIRIAWALMAGDKEYQEVT